MSTIIGIYFERPAFAPTDARAGAERFTVHSENLGRDLFVDAVGGEPAATQVESYLGLDNAGFNQKIDQQIAALEQAAGGYVRGMREVFLGQASLYNLRRARLQQLATDVAAAADLPALKTVVAGFATDFAALFPDFGTTPGMVRIKDLDDQIKPLRQQRRA